MPLPVKMRTDYSPAQLRVLAKTAKIGAVRTKLIIGAWAEQNIIREAMVYLNCIGVGTSRAVRIYKTCGSNAVQVITENLYRLAQDILGIWSLVSNA